jgi:hypothetical protein
MKAGSSPVDSIKPGIGELSMQIRRSSAESKIDFNSRPFANMTSLLNKQQA